MRVAQCWDDGVEDDIRLIEILRRHGARASFNLNPGRHENERSCCWKYKDVKEVWRLPKGDLLSVYAGFVVANHTFSHPHLTRIPLADATREIREGRDALEQLFGYSVTGFVYPFGEHNQEIQNAVRDAGHVYGRTAGGEGGTILPRDPMGFHPTCHFLSPGFWSEYERARADDGIFYFWGHSYEIMNEADWHAFEEQIRRISQDPVATWVDLPDLFKPGGLVTLSPVERHAVSTTGRSDD